MSTKDIGLLFQFKRKSMNTCQDPAFCTSLSNMLVEWTRQTQGDDTGRDEDISETPLTHLDPFVHDRDLPIDGTFTAQEKKVIRQAIRPFVRPLNNVKQGMSWIEKWFPSYGAALRVRVESIGVLMVHVDVLALDGWKRVLHFLPNDICEHNAKPTSSTILPCGRIKLSRLPIFLQKLDEAIQNARGRHSSHFMDDHMSGHQKTSQYLVMMMKHVLNDLSVQSDVFEIKNKGPTHPRGGTTDVGRHTGSNPRDTCWPLVYHVWKRSFPIGSALFNKTFVSFKSDLLEKHLACFPQDNDSVFWEHMDDSHEMLESIVDQLIELSKQTYDVRGMEKKCQEWRTHFDGLVKSRCDQLTRKYILQDIATTPNYPQLSCPQYLDMEQFTGSLKSQPPRQGMEFLKLEQCTIVDLFAWLDSITCAAVCCRVIEDYMMLCSAKLIGENRKSIPSPSDLLKLVNRYHALHQQRLAQRQHTTMVTEQYSMHTLVCWVAFALVHQQCIVTHPRLCKYAIALQPSRLEVLVLSDTRARETILNVVQYINTWHESPRNGPVFDLNNIAPTIAYGQEMSFMYKNMAEQEIELQNKRAKEQWNAIEKRKNDVAILRRKETELNVELKEMEKLHADEMDKLVTIYGGRHVTNDTTRYYQQQINTISDSIRSTTTTINHLIRLKEFIINRLPYETQQASMVLFFLHMPEDLNILSHLICTAQQTLGAPVFDSTLGKSWCAHYNTSRCLSMPSSENKYFTLFPFNLKVPGTFGPWTIDMISDYQDFLRQRMWYPSASNLDFRWENNQNPFRITIESSRRFFTDSLPKDYTWMNEFPGGSTRENTAYAQYDQCSKTNDINFASYVTLGSLRSHPCQQLQRVFTAIQTDKLAWSDPNVAIVVRQAVFQIGELYRNKGIRSQLLWHMELQDSNTTHDFYKALCYLTDVLQASPRRSDCIPLIGALVGFLSQYFEDCTELLNRLVQMSYTRANEIRTKSQRESITENELSKAKLEEALLIGYALMSFAIGRQETDELCELVVLFYSARLYSAPSIKLDALAHHVSDFMVHHVEMMTAFVQEDYNRLTRLAQLVNSMVPSDLVWHQVRSRSISTFSSCFEAKSQSHAVYLHINLFTGEVLVNGSVPGRLPAHLRQSNVYQSLFDKDDFEVHGVGSVFTTSFPFHERYYRFRENNPLDIEEFTAPPCINTLQLCSPAFMSQFKNIYPRRLVELYSHWFWKEGQCVLLRPLRAKDRRVFFFVVFNQDAALCYQVPIADQSLPYSMLLSRKHMYCVVVNPPTQLTCIFTKLEHEFYIHTLISVITAQYVVDLPRFGIRFLQEKTGRFRSENYEGFVLGQVQVLDNELYRFHRYLILEDETKKRRLLIPRGQVIETESGVVDIEISDDPSDHVDLLVFDEHPRFHIWEAGTIETRLQLCAIYAASGNRTPWASMTGGEMALLLLRRCVPSRPFTNTAIVHLETIIRFSRHTPCLKLMVVLLWIKSQRLSFLYGAPQSLLCDYTDALDEYIYQCEYGYNPVRQTLTVNEERELLGHYSAIQHTSETHLHVSKRMLPIPVPKDFVRQMEKELCAYTNTTPCPIAEFPITYHTVDVGAKEAMEEIELSWQCHHRQQQTLSIDLKQLVSRLQSSSLEVQSSRNTMQQYLCSSVQLAWSNSRLHLASIINRKHRTIVLADIVQSAISTENHLSLVSHLSTDERYRFCQAVLQWMELCVLEDRLERLIGRAKTCMSAGSTELSLLPLVDELQCVRHWKSSEHPLWLVFEVEGQLQIRPEQYVIAEHLIKHPGSVCQLNMGRGKTRVILPMLFLHYSKTKDSATHSIVRAHFLGPLLCETRDFMQRVLSASILQLPFMEMPFHRQMVCDEDKLLSMQGAIEDLRRNGGFLLLAPEHRLSLELKRLELQMGEGSEFIVRQLDQLLDIKQYINVFDESDALLHYKYELVYSVGIPFALNDGCDRWLVAEALVRVLQSPHSKHVSGVLRGEPFMYSTRVEYSERRGGYNGFRLNTMVDDMNAKARTALRIALIKDLMAQCPLEMEWFGVVSKNDKIRSQLIDVLTDPSIDTKEALNGEFGELLRTFSAQILSLRGLIAFGVLESCLEKRNRVEYGIPAPGTRPKSLAIPFKAADLPSERSEFSHPDVLITLTLLGYYHTGLSDQDIRRTFVYVLSLDQSEQRQYYREWYNAVESHLDMTHKEVLCEVERIDIRNEDQFSLICDIYRYTMEVINFFLNRLVFPRDTKQYPTRLSRTAWDLVRGPANIGFSGTNDNHRLLPLNVNQQEPKDETLLGTNGKMIALMEHATNGFIPLVDETMHIATWKSLLLLALRKKCDALIDTGALLAGISTERAATFLVEQSDFNASGVTYYCTSNDVDGWVILDTEKKMRTLLQYSSIKEKDTFVLFDEARSRGSDMKLRSDAVALVTLGPNLTKDKFMQGAGRMRQLGSDQRLWITGTDEVCKSIIKMDGASIQSIQILDVIRWVMENTHQQCTMGLLEWAEHGAQFRARDVDPTQELMDENWTLEAQYSAPQSPTLITTIVDRKIERYLGTKGRIDEVASELSRRGLKYGAMKELCVTSYGEECERELQIEIQQEQVAEVVRPSVSPCQGVDWKYDILLHASSARDLMQETRLIPLQEAASSYLPIAWESTKLYGTKNFWSTVTHTTIAYLRLVDTLILFKDGTILIVSEREADAIVRRMRTTWQNQTSDFCVMNLEFMCDALRRAPNAHLRDVPLMMSLSKSKTLLEQPLPVDAVMACNLFNGETHLVAPWTQKILSKLLQRLKQRENILQKFICARRFHERWLRSCLQIHAHRMDLEDNLMDVEKKVFKYALCDVLSLKS